MFGLTKQEKKAHQKPYLRAIASGAVCFWCLAGCCEGVVAAEPVAAVSVAAESVAAESRPERLFQLLQITTTTTDIRQIAQAIQQGAGLPLFVDRRVDPDSIKGDAGEPKGTANDPGMRDGEDAQVVVYGPDLATALDLLTKKAGIGWASDGAVVLLGPEPQVVQAATGMMVEWDELQKKLKNKRGKWSQEHEVLWPEATTPQAALEIVAQLWELDISTVTLPYDLWPAVDLGALPVTSALGVIGVGFDLSLAVDPDTARVTVRPLSEVAMCTRTYRAVALTGQQQTAITSQSLLAPARLQKEGQGWLLRGDARAHLEMQRALSAVESPGVAAGKSNGKPRGKKVEATYTLRLADQVGKVLRVLAQNAGKELRVESSAQSKMDQRIELTAENKTLSELIEMVTKAAGLEAAVSEQEIVVRAPAVD